MFDEYLPVLASTMLGEGLQTAKRSTSAIVRRDEINDEAWEQIAPLLPNLLPKNGHRGKQWCDHRRIANGIL